MLPPNTSILSETKVRLGEGRKLPHEPHPSRSTLMRWIDPGLFSHVTRSFVSLEWCQEGASRVTSVEAYHRFQKRLNGEEPSAVEPEESTA